MCFFPEWMMSAGSYSATAKLINKGSSYPPDISSSTTYGGFHRIPSNTITFATTPGLNTLTLNENPSVYSSPKIVNTKHTSTYTLSLNLDSGSILNPIVYVDFQKSGFIPDESFCADNTVFKYCRVYNTYRNIIVA